LVNPDIIADLNLIPGFFGVEFKIERLRLHWLAFFHLMPSMGYGNITIALLKILNKIISGIANISPNVCSRIWCFWVGGFEEIEFEFTPIK